MPADISEWCADLDAFQKELCAFKAQLAPSEFAWYPYDSAGNVDKLQTTLTGDNRRLDWLLGDGPVLDVCCGDGDLSFFLEARGYKVDAIDFPPTNYNRMQGLRRLKEARGSKIAIHEMNLDGRFTLPPRIDSLGIFFGALYHLRNPFFVLEELGMHCHHCLLSTRIASHTPDGKTDLAPYPLAYLVDPGELNGDGSNYWVFSDTGLKRLIRRAGWDIVDYATQGATQGSDPVAPDRDERAFMLLRSRYLGGVPMATMSKGFHEIENRAWAWTARRFSLRIARVPQGSRRLRIPIVFPDVAFAKTAALQITASWNGQPLARVRFQAPGDLVYESEIPQPAGESAEVDFELSAAMPPDEQDKRERGLIIHLAALQRVLEA